MMTVCAGCGANIRNRLMASSYTKSDKARFDRKSGSWFHKNCYNKELYHRKKNQQKTVQIFLPHYSNLHGCCLFRQCGINSPLHHVLLKLRNKCLAYNRTFIGKETRVCTHHFKVLKSLSFTVDELNKTSDSFWVIPEDNTELIKMLMNCVNSEVKKARPLSLNSLSESQLQTITGFTRNHMESLKLYTYEFFTDPNTIPIYFFKMRTGLSDNMIGALMNKSRQAISDQISTARTALKQGFIHRYLGMNLLNSAQLHSHTTDVARALFGPNKKILVLDGTYIYCQKSSNFDFQRLSYSLHKHRNLLKMFMAIATDGRIIDVTGPFDANISDANLLEDLLCRNEFLQAFPPCETILIVDRGFRNVIELVRRLGYQVFMSAFLEAKQKQLTTQAANETRFTTKLRYIVEVVNGQLKQTFGIFNKTAYNRSLPHTPDDFKICCAAMNMQRNGGFISDATKPEIMDQMNRLRKIPNILFSIVDANRLIRRAAMFKAMDSEPQAQRFPKFTESQVEIYYCGSYQVKMGKCYCAEHLKPDGRYLFSVEKEDKQIDYKKYYRDCNPVALKLFRAKMDSRHSKRTKYFLFVLLDLEAEDPIDVIKEHYCTCTVGTRTVGCCAHVACLIWYMTVGCYLPKIKMPAESLSTLLSPVFSFPELDNPPEFDDLEELFCQERIVLEDESEILGDPDDVVEGRDVDAGGVGRIEIHWEGGEEDDEEMDIDLDIGD